MQKVCARQGRGGQPEHISTILARVLDELEKRHKVQSSAQPRLPLDLADAYVRPLVPLREKKGDTSTSS